MSNISLISLFFKISLIQSILCKSSFNLLLSNLSKFLLHGLVLGSGFGVMKSSRITNLIKWLLSLETLTSIIRTGLPIMVELIDLVNSVIVFLSQMTLPRWLTFLQRCQTLIVIVLLVWTYFFLLMLVFVLQCLSLH